ncbi:hypothetical protein FF021_17850 [Leptospira noguchii]|nr:hypothetical protein FF021_17850 [Leptospira noguchii]
MGLAFVTFNRYTRLEESTALRLQTISNLYGVSIELPFRTEGLDIKEETKRRIDRSEIVFCFSLGLPSDEVSSEIKYALENNKTVIHIFNLGVQTPVFGHANFLNLSVDFSKEPCSNILNQISKFLTFRFGRDKRLNVLNAIFSISLGMLALHYFEDESQ